MDDTKDIVSDSPVQAPTTTSGEDMGANYSEDNTTIDYTWDSKSPEGLLVTLKQAENDTVPQHIYVKSVVLQISGGHPVHISRLENGDYDNSIVNEITSVYS